MRYRVGLLLLIGVAAGFHLAVMIEVKALYPPGAEPDGAAHARPASEP